ncbi:MAG: putative UDP-glucose 4-epimerase GalE1 [Chthonomonadaceae bacterium]|uniref:LPS biosynthesis protein WbpP n=1 Tax=Candidatus Nitrosymbiomonas proteolyticus TaxID=2608984 RepID=A0A809R7N1_9BACT|nr:LPS biosynthesis protein WbpP [Candidatus Nitrosymbiomonas proteolyticus]
MKALVTGGAGFIGSHVALGAAAKGWQVVVLDDLSSGSPSNLTGAPSHLEMRVGSVCDPEAVRSAVEGCDVVFHLAAIASVQRSVEDPVGTGRVNVEGMVRVLEAATRAGSRVVFSSSSAVYGDADALPVSESARPLPCSPYAVHKLCGEMYLQAFWSTGGLISRSLRYFNVYGPRQDPQSEYAAVIPKFVTRAIRGEPLVIFGDGGQTRDFVFVEDVARANLLAAEQGSGESFVLNIGSGVSLSVLDLAKKVIEIAESNSQIVFEPPRPGEVRDSRADTALAHAQLGFDASTPLEEGLRRTLEYWRDRESCQ